MNSYILPADATVLVTGANGFIASHTVDKLLDQGFKVRGTVRTPKPWLNEFFDARYGKGRFETAIVSDFSDSQSVNNALQGVSGVIHMASDLSFSTDPSTVIPWVTGATRTILEVASKHETIRRVVLTSSSRACYMSTWASTRGIQIDENTWNEKAIKAAWDPATPEEHKAYAVYAASKTESEKQAWNWLEKNKPHFDFNTVLPDFNTGRVLHPEIPGSTIGFTRNLLKGDASALGLLPPQCYVDVEDVARLHLIALLGEKVKSQRIFAFAGSKNWTDILRVLRELRPSNTLIPDVHANERHDEAVILPAQKAEELLREFFGRQGWTSLEESLAAGITGFE
ncbi:NAD dependent epimerase/dehydratase [Aspergillus steynii IBT 23096]|uniref:NAD dependent epimerase/dehydratase n=1 Tax=Aspergillus steynii IBT 23096 TaxID=1392250 RepID=A0A2I2GSD4_9EURO|nr:NAD dependent epimerase/dehydratase [Aspergillus steynii IBT 23096]PLB55792.1 NAD dependent epimerase/dehydratase [Aspergillus steynii IBT 23096]